MDDIGNNLMTTIDDIDNNMVIILGTDSHTKTNEISEKLQGPFGTFLKIHLFWCGHISLKGQK